MKTKFLYMLVFGGPFFLAGVVIPSGSALVLVGIVFGWMGWTYGPKTSTFLEREGMHPRTLVQGRVKVTEEKPTEPTVNRSEPEPVFVEPPEPPVSASEPPVAKRVFNPKKPPPRPPAQFGSDNDNSEFELLESMGFIAPGADFVLGVDIRTNNQMLMPKLSSVGIGGAQGSGKTVSMLSLVIQAIAKYNGKVKFLVIDPHMNIDPNSDEADNSLAIKLASLDPFLLKNDGIGPNPVAGGDALLRWLTWIEVKFNARLGGEPIDDIIVVLADEFAGLMDNPEIGPMLNHLLTTINEQARKIGMFALVSSNQWKSKRIGGTDLRGSIATFLIHQMPAAIAQQIEPRYAQQASSLHVGEAILSSKGEAAIGIVPFAKPSYLERIVERYAPEIVLSLPAPTRFASVSPTSTVHVGYEEGMQIVRWYRLMLQANMEWETEDITSLTALKVYGNASEESLSKVQHAMALNERHQV